MEHNIGRAGVKVREVGRTRVRSMRLGEARDSRGRRPYRAGAQANNNAMMACNNENSRKKAFIGSVEKNSAKACLTRLSHEAVTRISGACL